MGFLGMKVLIFVALLAWKQILCVSLCEPDVLAVRMIVTLFVIGLL